MALFALFVLLQMMLLGMANFLRTFIPSFSEMAAPLTDLLEASGPGTRRIAWSVEYDTAFNMLKTTPTLAPVLRHFNPDLRTAVHIDVSQNAVGAVQLQWQPGQMALTTWRTILLGVQFEIYSDHDTLKWCQISCHAHEIPLRLFHLST